MDADLIKRAKAGDKWAIEDVFKGCEKLLRRQCWRFSEFSDVDEGMQEARIGVMNAIRLYEGQYKFEVFAWYHIRKRVHIYLKRLKKVADREDLMGGYARIIDADGAPSPEHRALLAEVWSAADRLDKALAPPSHVKKAALRRASLRRASLRKLCGSEETFEQIGKAHGVTRECARLYEAQVLGMLRHMVGAAE